MIPLAENLPYLEGDLVYTLECKCPCCGNKHEVKEFWGEGIPKTPRVFCKECKKVINRQIKYQKEREASLEKRCHPLKKSVDRNHETML